MRSTRFPVKKKRIKSSIKRPKLSYTKKSIAPLIAVILLVVVAVILVTLILSVSKNVVLESLDKTTQIYKEDTSLTGYIYSSNPQPDSFTVKNLSKKPIEITHYEIVSVGDSEVLNRPLPLSSSVTLNSGSSVPIPVLCSPSSSYKINLITTDGTYVSVPVNNVNNYQSNSCDSSEIPDPVCLGITENGNGDTNSDPIVICSVDDLNDVRNGLDKHYKLGTNLDLNISPYNEGEGWLPIGGTGWYNPFYGSLNGNGYSINNLYINRPSTGDNAGLFGYLESANINNLGLKDVNIIGYYYVSSLVGYSWGSSISNCYSTGNISGGENTGGLIGALGDTNLSNSYSMVNVNSNGYVGGLVGDVYDGILLNNYSVGFVEGISAGGLIGRVNTGLISNNYYDYYTSGQSDRYYGLPKTTMEMKQESTFENWDFTNIWTIDEGINYPYLKNNIQLPHPEPIIYVGTSTYSNYFNTEYTITLISNGNRIYYTLNNNTPNCIDSGTEYTEPILINENTNLKAIACNANLSSNIFSKTYYKVDATGSGTEEDPYILFNVTDFNIVLRNNLNSYFKLGQDVDFNLSPYNEGTGWMPLGGENLYSPYNQTYSIPFTGVFDGQDNKIINLYINRPTSPYQGLFGYSSLDSEIKNLKLEDVNIIGKEITGSLIGMNKGEISNCSSEGNVYGQGYSGGLVGLNYGTIATSNSSINMSGTGLIGGLVGYNLLGTITDSNSTGNVSATSSTIGGLVGGNGYGIIENCYSKGNVSSLSHTVGGLVGDISNGATISKSYSTGTVSGTSAVGGLVGTSYQSTILNSYSVGNVSAGSFAGGLVGTVSSNAVIDKSYSAGVVSGSSNLGGLVSSNYGNISNSFYDTNVSGRSDTGKGTPKTTSQMKTQSTFTGWDFDAVWAIDAGSTYPYLINIIYDVNNPKPQ